ncbi:MAG: hypothetical protein ACLSGS_06535 [Adlercreutzia sp.]
MAKTSKIAKAPKSFKSYALNKCLIGSAVNGVSTPPFRRHNAGAYACLVCDIVLHPRLHPACSSACCCSPASCRSPAWIAGVFSCRCGGRCSACLLVLRGLHSGVGALAAVVDRAGPFFPWHCRPPATVTGMMFLKGLVCALGGAVAGWFTISFVVRGQQKADEVAAAMASKTAEAAL